MQQILALTEAEWQEMARGHNILLKQTQASVLMSEQKVNLERAERLPSIAIVAADHLDGPVTIEVPVLDYMQLFVCGIMMADLLVLAVCTRYSRMFRKQLAESLQMKKPR